MTSLRSLDVLLGLRKVCQPIVTKWQDFATSASEHPELLQRSTKIYKGQISYLKSQHSTNPLPCLPCFVRHHSNSAKLREKSDKLLLMRKLSDCEVVLPIPLNWSNKDDSTLEAMHSTDWQQKINVCGGPIPPRTQVAWIPHIKGFGNLNIPLMQMTLSSSGRSRRCAGRCRNTWSWGCRWCRWCCRTTARGISPLTHWLIQIGISTCNWYAWYEQFTKNDGPLGTLQRAPTSKFQCRSNTAALVLQKCLLSALLVL